MSANFQLPNAPMRISEAVSASFKLWFENLSSVLVFSFLSGVINTLPEYIHLSSSLNLFVKMGIGVVALIPNTAVFAKLIHAGHRQPISSSQALAVSLTKFPQLLLLFAIVILVCVSPLVGILKLQAVYSSNPTALPAWLFGTSMLLFMVYCMAVMIIGIYCTLIVPVMLSENKALIPAVKKSFTLVKDAWWYTSIVLSVPFFVTIIAQIGLAALIGKSAILFGQAIFMPLNVAVIVILYEHHVLRLNQHQSY